jgi:hypothetical protein
MAEADSQGDIRLGHMGILSSQGILLVFLRAGYIEVLFCSIFIVLLLFR